MTENEAKSYMENEIRCIQKASCCDRNCAKCELVKEEEPLLEAFGVTIITLEEIQQYRAIGTIEEFKALKEKNEPKKAEYRKMVYPRHKWMEEDGKIDEFAYSNGYCNGPMCERCYYSFCEHCNPDGWEEECVVEDYICPSCGEKVRYKPTHCKCGQALDWSE